MQNSKYQQCKAQSRLKVTYSNIHPVLIIENLNCSYGHGRIDVNYIGQNVFAISALNQKVHSGGGNCVRKVIMRSERQTRLMYKDVPTK